MSISLTRRCSGCARAYGLAARAEPASPYVSTGNGDDPRGGRSAYRAIEEWLAGHLRY